MSESDHVGRVPVVLGRPAPGETKEEFARRFKAALGIRQLLPETIAGTSSVAEPPPDDTESGTRSPEASTS